MKRSVTLISVVRRAAPPRGGAGVDAALREIAVPVEGEEGATATLRTNACAPGAGEATPLLVTVNVTRATAAGGAGAGGGAGVTYELPSSSGRPDRTVVKLLQNLALRKTVADGEPLCRAAVACDDEGTLTVRLEKLDVGEGAYVYGATLQLTVSACRRRSTARRFTPRVITACAVCARAQMATSVASGEDFSRQLAALQGRLAAAKGDLALQRRVMATMRSLVLEASRSLFDLPRLETAVRGVVAGEAEVRRDVVELRAALAAAEARHAAELRAQRLALEGNMARQIQEAIRAAEERWTAAVAHERTAREAAIRDEAGARASAAEHMPGMLSWFKSRATSEAAGYAAFAEVAGWRPYPKDAAMSAAEDAGLKHGGAIADDAITASSFLRHQSDSGETTCPPQMCRLDRLSNGTQCPFAPATDDAVAGGPWVQVQLCAVSVMPLLVCGAVLQGANDATNFKYCWKGTTFQVSMDGEAWTAVAGGEVSTDGRATWTPVGADRIFRRTAAMKADAKMYCRWDVAHRCRYVRAVLKEKADGTPSQLRWEVLKLKAGV
jgi:hypothetical protein